jgi:putative NADH-flavin reductase
VMRNSTKLEIKHKRLRSVHGNVLDPTSVEEAVSGHDAVVSAVGPGREGSASLVVEAAQSLLEGLRRAGVQRLVVVGGAGSLEVKPGVQLVDTPEFPDAWRAIAMAHRDALNVYRGAEDVDWTYVSPAALLEPGKRTGTYRKGFDRLLVDAKGESRISAEDYAVAIVDELERRAFPRQRISVAY